MVAALAVDGASHGVADEAVVEGELLDPRVHPAFRREGRLGGAVGDDLEETLPGVVARQPDGGGHGTDRGRPPAPRSARIVGVAEEDLDVGETEPEFFRGDLGQPWGGFPEALQTKVLKGDAPLSERPGAVLAPADLEEERGTAERKLRRHITDLELASYLMYPQVFLDYAKARRSFSTPSAM